jgi:RES domain-containing protein
VARLDIDAVPVAGTWVRHLPAGGDPRYRTSVPASGRWQRGSTVAAVYLADEPQTAWAEWYRALAESETRPLARMPRDLWRYAVALDRVADLSTGARLARVGLPEPAPSRAQWPAFQTVGEQLWSAGYSGVLFSSASRPAGRCLCVFRPGAALPGLRPVPPPAREHEPPPPPRGLRT